MVDEKMAPTDFDNPDEQEDLITTKTYQGPCRRIVDRQRRFIDRDKEPELDLGEKLRQQ